MKNVQCGGLIFGQGLPKICVPLVGKSIQEIEQEYQKVQSLPADFLEWRADCFEEDIESVLSFFREKNGTVKRKIPVLATLRTRNEGGQWEGNPQEYESLLSKLMESKLFQMIDIEFSSGASTVAAMILKAKKYGMLSVVSKHDFLKTPPVNEIYRDFITMKKWGADLPKYAAMPQNTEDVLNLMTTSLQAERQVGPLIAISMGKLGKLTRIGGHFFGSSVTFAAGADASAPGQIPCEEVYRCLQMLEY